MTPVILHGVVSPEHGDPSGATAPCKVTPVILHGRVLNESRNSMKRRQRTCFCDEPRCRAIVVGLGPNKLRSYKMRTSRWTVIISKQVICTAEFKLKTLHVQKCPSRSSHLVTSKFVWAKSYQSGSAPTSVGYA